MHREQVADLPLQDLGGEVLVNELQVVGLERNKSASNSQVISRSKKKNIPSTPQHWEFHHSCCTGHKD